MSDERDETSEAPVPDQRMDFERPGPGRGGPRFGPVGSASGNGLEPGRIPGEPLPVDGEVESGAASEWPQRDEWALPREYGEDTVVAMVRDPWWVFVYWELAETTRAEARTRAGEGARFVLRLHEVGGGEQLLSEVDVPDITAGDWYVPVTAPRLRVQAAMGFVGTDGVFHPVFSSPEVPVPAFEPIPPLGDEDSPEAQLFDYSGGREMRDVTHWRKMRTRPIIWKRRKFGGWWSVRGESGSGSGAGSGSGSGFGIYMEMRFGPEGPELEEAGRPSSPTSPVRPFSPSSAFGGKPRGEDRS